MKKCRNCGGENSNSEIYCDWCGEYLPNVEKPTIFSFIRYFFHSFALLGILGAIIFYIANIVNEPRNLEFLNQTLIGISFKNVLQVGLFIGLVFFIILLGLLIFELLKVVKHGFSIKILLFLLLYFWIFAILIFAFIGKDWVNLISLVIAANFTFIIYLEIFYHFLEDIDGRKKRQRMGTMSFLSFVLLIIFVIFSPIIQNFISIGARIALPFESEPQVLGLLLNGAAVGILLGLLVAFFFSGVMIYGEMIRDIKKKTEDFYQKIHLKIPR
jgi:hypothetical protein